MVCYMQNTKLGVIVVLKQFNLLLNEYASIANEIAELANSLDNHALLNTFRLQADKIKNTEFHVVVIGQFKRGKSTLINCLLGDDILPTGVIPITSIVTKIKYGESAEAMISFLNNEIVKINIEDVAAYISEQYNPQNVKNVQVIDIFYPSEILKNGLVLIDTPGIGSIHKHNTEEAYKHIPQADAAIFLISSDAPISELESEFLADIKKHFNKFFFVQNKIDYLTEDEREESVAFSKNIICKVIGSEIKIYPISAKQAYEAKKSNDLDSFIKSGMKKFQEDLEQFLIKEKGQYLMNSYEKKIWNMLEELDENIQFKINLLNSPIEHLQKQLDTFKDRLHEISRLKKEALALVELNLKEIVDHIEVNINDFRRQKGIAIKARLKSLYEENHQMKFNRLSKFLNSSLESLVEEGYTQWDIEQRIELSELFRDVIIKFTSKLNEAIDQVNHIAYEIFKLNIAQHVEEMELINKDTFYLKFGSASPAFLAPKLRDFLFLFPQNFKHKVLLSDLMKRVDEELEKNGNNLKWDYSCKIRDSKYVFERIYQDKINDIIANIENIVGRTIALRNQEATRIENDLKHFQERAMKVTALRTKMDELKPIY